MMFERLTILSLNVNGLRGSERRSNLFTWLKLSHTDIIFLQDTHWTPEDSKLWSEQWGFTALWSSHNAILSTNRSITLTTIDTPTLPRILIAKVSHPSFTEEYFVGSSYLPADRLERSQFLDTLPLSLPMTLSLLVGDFNILANPALDHVPAQSAASHPHWNYLSSTLQRWELVDLLRTQSETKVQCTHWQTSGHSRVGTRIDYIFIDPALDSLFSPLEASICPFTDHISLSTSLKVHSNAPHGASTWKFNISLLQSDLFRSAVEKLWH